MEGESQLVDVLHAGLESLQDFLRHDRAAGGMPLGLLDTSLRLTGLHSVSFRERVAVDVERGRISVALGFEGLRLQGEPEVHVEAGPVLVDWTFILRWVDGVLRVGIEGARVQLGEVVRVDGSARTSIAGLEPLCRGMSAFLEGPLAGLAARILSQRIAHADRSIDRLVELHRRIRAGESLRSASLLSPSARILSGFGGVGQLPVPRFWRLPEVSERERARIALVSLLERAQSGDVVLFSGTRASSQRIRRLTQSAFSHVAMVVRDAELAPGALLWQASSGPHSGVLRGMERRAGIQLNPLGEALHDYLGECPGARFVHRSLHTRADPALLCKRQAALNDLVRRLDGGPYTPDMDGLYVLGLMELGTAPPNEFFCAGAVAEALMEMGILTRTFQHWQYTPRDFSEEQSELPFAQTEERYAPEVQIEL